jgi:hypothetical protein
MHSTKLTGLVIVFLMTTFLFHFLFQIKPGFSPIGVWIASVAFGIISAYILNLSTKQHHAE